MKTKAFTLVELLVAMAIIAILLALSVFGLSVLQQNARDTLRRSKVSEIEIAVAGLIAAQQPIPTSFPDSDTTAITIGDEVIPLPDILARQDTDLPSDAETTASITDYCYGSIGNNLYVIGVKLEGGTFYYATNSGATYNTSSGSAFTAAPISGSGPDCSDANL